ncbi:MULTISPECIES: divalent-cation tolerance protein CutA [Catenuloplanes]|uniref:Periplasmic divalent cation tolerance protein n=1 Tax=Catenuloplanes niger TaxID=587534 RepID=A0AAE3ZNT6_9ACTN|nr:divalent-cation tolerance protein CutA [Catenuloplanes niger]MDR7323358.1 periplasmic divalent cation tolerance protein [Catenuloplanes niger]
MTDALLVATAVPSHDDAVAIARAAIEASLAGSAQIVGPVESVFRHLGEVGTGEEWQVLLRTTDASYAALEAHLVEAHPWDNPEVIAIPLVRATPAYLAWLQRATTAPQA